jgi:prophage regulatory protein
MKQDEKMTNKFLPKAVVDDMTGLSDVTRWRMEKRDEFPKRRQISPNRVAYLESEILAWMESRPASSIKPENEQEGAA